MIKSSVEFKTSAVFNTLLLLVCLNTGAAHIRWAIAEELGAEETNTPQLRRIARHHKIKPLDQELPETSEQPTASSTVHIVNELRHLRHDEKAALPTASEYDSRNVQESAEATDPSVEFTSSEADTLSTDKTYSENRHNPQHNPKEDGRSNGTTNGARKNGVNSMTASLRSADLKYSPSAWRETCYPLIGVTLPTGRVEISKFNNALRSPHYLSESDSNPAAVKFFDETIHPIQYNPIAQLVKQYFLCKLAVIVHVGQAKHRAKALDTTLTGTSRWITHTLLPSLEQLEDGNNSDDSQQLKILARSLTQLKKEKYQPKIPDEALVIEEHTKEDKDRAAIVEGDKARQKMTIGVLFALGGVLLFVCVFVGACVAAAVHSKQIEQVTKLGTDYLPLGVTSDQLINKSDKRVSLTVGAMAAPSHTAEQTERRASQQVERRESQQKGERRKSQQQPTDDTSTAVTTTDTGQSDTTTATSINQTSETSADEDTELMSSNDDRSYGTLSTAAAHK